MKVFNLTEQYVDYRKKTLPPYGSLDYDMDFIPNRDQELQKAGVLSFGSLPPGWSRPMPVVDLPLPAVPVEAPVALPVVLPVSNPGPSSKVEFASDKEEKKSKK